jgi:hypothetical protein
MFVRGVIGPVTRFNGVPILTYKLLARVQVVFAVELSPDAGERRPSSDSRRGRGDATAA